MLPGYSPSIVYAGDIPQRVSFVASAISGDATIVIPSAAQAGDLVVILQMAANTVSTVPTAVTPAGFTDISNISSNVQNYNPMRNICSYKVITAADKGATLTGMEGNNSNRKMLLVFRTIHPITAITPVSIQTHNTTSAPSLKTITVAGQPAPVILMGQGSTIGADVTLSGTVATEGVIVNSSNNRQTAAYLIQNDVVANKTFNQSNGNVNMMQCFGLVVT
jgi:hypothetical protein